MIVSRGIAAGAATALAVAGLVVGAGTAGAADGGNHRATAVVVGSDVQVTIKAKNAATDCFVLVFSSSDKSDVDVVAEVVNKGGIGQATPAEFVTFWDVLDNRIVSRKDNIALAANERKTIAVGVPAPAASQYAVLTDCTLHADPGAHTEKAASFLAETESLDPAGSLGGGLFGSS